MSNPVMMKESLLNQCKSLDEIEQLIKRHKIIKISQGQDGIIIEQNPEEVIKISFPETQMELKKQTQNFQKLSRQHKQLQDTYPRYLGFEKYKTCHFSYIRMQNLKTKGFIEMSDFLNDPSNIMKRFEAIQNFLTVLIRYIDRDIYHMDLHLQNIMIQPETLQIKIIDFSKIQFVSTDSIVQVFFEKLSRFLQNIKTHYHMNFSIPDSISNKDELNLYLQYLISKLDRLEKQQKDNRYTT